MPHVKWQGLARLHTRTCSKTRQRKLADGSRAGSDRRVAFGDCCAITLAQRWIRGKSATGGDPPSTVGHGSGIGRDDSRSDDLAPMTGVALIGTDVDLSHPRIDRSDDPVSAGLIAARLSDRLERGHAYYGQVGSEREPLRDAAGDAQSRERSRAGAEGDAIDLLQAHAALGEYRPYHRKQKLGVPLSGNFAALKPIHAVTERDSADFGRGVEGKNSHRSNSTRPGHVRCSRCEAMPMPMRAFGTIPRLPTFIFRAAPRVTRCPSWIPSSSPRSIRKAEASRALRARRCSSKAR